MNSGILRPMIEGWDRLFANAESLLREAIRVIFPSYKLVRLALQFTTNPKQLQQNLFGGKFLENVGEFNLSRALGTRGTFNFSQFFQQFGLPGFQNGRAPVSATNPLSVGLESGTETRKSAEEKVAMNKTVMSSFGFEVNLQENLVALKFLTSLLELPEFLLFLKHLLSVPVDLANDLGQIMEMALSSQGCEQTLGSLFVPSCTKDGSYEEVQCFAGECWCVDSWGQELSGSRLQGRKPRCPTQCEKQRAHLQSLSDSQPAGSSLFVPSCTSEGHFLPVQCFGSECYCVDADGQIIPETQSRLGEPAKCK